MPTKCPDSGCRCWMIGGKCERLSPRCQILELSKARVARAAMLNVDHRQSMLFAAQERSKPPNRRSSDLKAPVFPLRGFLFCGKAAVCGHNTAGTSAGLDQAGASQLVDAIRMPAGPFRPI